MNIKKCEKKDHMGLYEKKELNLNPRATIFVVSPLTKDRPISGLPFPSKAVLAVTETLARDLIIFSW